MAQEPKLPIRLGFIGLSATGWAATALAPPLFEDSLSSKYSLVAVSTSKQESAETSAAKYSELPSKATGTSVVVKPYHGSAKHIASERDLDMIAVSVKVLDHKEVASEVIEAGKDLFIEWPAGRHVKETKELYEAAKLKGIKSLLGFQSRFTTYALKAKEIVDSGDLGEILSSTFIISITSFWGHFMPSNYRYTLSSSNGATLLDIPGGHALDLFTHILGPISSLSAVIKNQISSTTLLDSDGNPTEEVVPNDTPNQVCVMGSLASGALFTVHLQAPAKEADFNWIIQGEKGVLRIVDDSDRTTKQGFFDATPNVYLNGEKVAIPTDDATKQTGRNWEAFADGNVSKYADLEQALKLKEILQAIVRSSEDGRRVDLQ
ncbi:NAD-binding Rossmann fold oxidoreductase [Lentinula aciculospora]|uniref:NAD-binding Rossmann fold oxidoreductase n=1 Tax=Lentinula aciculospora TaxID=153920 RepID=A0A9W8ZUG6_9AGAR|nr:NAD-binding Rossmann fold oxidoreductase [Lentinula aciculospora]